MPAGGAPATAQETVTDLDRGSMLALRCVTCHHPAAASDAIPRISGLREREFTDKMRRYRDGAGGKSVMGTRASRLTDQEIEELARHFGAQPRVVRSDE